jgi:hypothetical protein
MSTLPEGTEADRRSSGRALQFLTLLKIRPKSKQRTNSDTFLTVQQLESGHDAALSQWRLEVERARYEAERAERQYNIRLWIRKIDLSRVA